MRIVGKRLFRLGCILLLMALGRWDAAAAGELRQEDPASVSNLVSGLRATNVATYLTNFEKVNQALRTSRSPELLCQALLAQLDSFQDRPYVENLLVLTTNRFMEQIARKLYLAERQRGAEYCERAMGIIEALAVYHRGDDLRMFLEDLRAKPNGINFAAEFRPWTGCGLRRGPFGVLAYAVLEYKDERGIGELFKIYGAADAARKDAILAAISRSSATTRGLVDGLAAKSHLAEIRQAAQGRYREVQTP